MFTLEFAFLFPLDPYSSFLLLDSTLYTSIFQEIREIISKEAQREDNEYMDSFVVIIYGTPDGFDFSLIPQVLNNTNAPNLEGKPKLIYVIGTVLLVLEVVVMHVLFPSFVWSVVPF